MIQEAYFRPGLRIRHKFSVGRIKNANATAGKLVTWARMRELWSKFDLGFKPDVIFMTERSLSQLTDELVTPENPNPTSPTVFNGVPIATTHSISNAEDAA